MRIAHLTRAAAARRRLADEAGSFLIEAMVSALLVLIIGAGVLTMMSRGSQINGQQKAIATAGNLAQSEQETLRAYATSKAGLAYLSNLRRTVTPTRTVAGVPYSIVSRTDWINDANGTPSCTSDAAADYMKLTTTVTSSAFGNRKPVTLETLITPAARSFDANQGSLAVQVLGSGATPIVGLTMNLTGPKTLSDATSSNGCVLWGYLPAGGGYTVSASRGGYVQPSGSPTIAEPASVVGDQTANVNVEYDQAGGISAKFTTQRSSTAAVTSTAPQKAMIESSHAAFMNKSFPVTAAAGTQLDTGLALYPFADPYTIYAGDCAAAKPPQPANLGTSLAPRGATGSAVTIQIPALNIHVKNNGVAVSNAIVKVTSPCSGVTYTRSTDGAGLIDDPGFPYGNLQNVCVSDSAGTRKRAVGTVSNTTYPATDVTYDIGSSGPGGGATGACP